MKKLICLCLIPLFCFAKNTAKHSSYTYFTFRYFVDNGAIVDILYKGFDHGEYWSMEDKPIFIEFYSKNSKEYFLSDRTYREIPLFDTNSSFHEKLRNGNSITYPRYLYFHSVQELNEYCKLKYPSKIKETVCPRCKGTGTTGQVGGTDCFIECDRCKGNKKIKIIVKPTIPKELINLEKKIQKFRKENK